MKYSLFRRSNLMVAVLFFIVLAFLSCSKKGGNPAPQQPSSAITSLNVNSGPYTSSVTITGKGFSSTSADDHVFFNGKEAVITYATTTQLIATVPLAAGTGNVTVKLKDGTVLTGPVFTYQLSLVVSTVAGSITPGHANGVGAAASFNAPVGVAVDNNGNLFVADQSNQSIRKITPDGTVSTIAGGTYGNTDGVGAAASFKNPAGITIDHTGNIYVADYVNNDIRKVDPLGNVTTIAGTGSFGSSNGTGTAASFIGPTDVTVDGDGNVYVADYVNNMIRKITPVGVVTTLAGSTGSGAVDGLGTAARFNFPSGVAVDATGNVYVADSFNNKIRKITPAGAVTTIAGSGVKGSTDGTGAAATFSAPYYIAIDKDGNLYVTDQNLIRKIDASGVVTTIAGSSAPGAADGLAATATFKQPTGITVDGSGNIYIADSSNNLIRKISMQ